jgi:Ca-activated chloride channel homolog
MTHLKAVLSLAIFVLGATAAPFSSVVAQSTGASAVTLDIPSGERLILQLETSLHTRTSRQGDRVQFRTIEPVRTGGQVAIPSGSSVTATVSKVQRPGRVKGRAELCLRFEEVRLPDGTSLPLKASVTRAGLTQVGKGKQGDPQLKGEAGNGGSITVVAQGGLQGAVLGTMAGGAKGAAYGGAIGAGIGLASILLQRGPDLDLPRDMLFEAKLDQAFSVPVAVAQRSIQIAQNTSPPSPSSSTSPPRPILSRFPSTRETRPAEEKAEQVPDFTKDEAESADPNVVPAEAASRQPIPPASAPLPPPPDWDSGGYKLKVDVRLVMVDAMVRDRGGRPLENLKQQDFRIFEDGIEQEIQSFSRDELPLALALVIDRSGSVAPYMSEIRQAAYKALSQLKHGDQVALFTFAGEVQRLEDLTTNRQKIADRISEIRAGGGTNIVDGLFDAVNYLSLVAPDRRRAVILISDNQATTRPRMSQDQLVRFAMESETVIYSVKTPGEAAPVTMRVPLWLGGFGSVSKITEETGGEIIDVSTTGSLDAAMGAVISRLKLRYTLGYQSTNKAGDGAFRRIDVRLSDRFGRPNSDYSVNARRGYYAGAENAAAQTR